jgi:hypothetical protein
VRANTMSRKQGDPSDAESGNTDEEGDDAEQLTPSLDDEDMITPCKFAARKKRKDTLAFGAGGLAGRHSRKALRAIADDVRLKLENERLSFEKERAEAHDRHEEKRLDIMAA